ncbi:MAG TPA: DUF3048 domain-containing protein [Candidatus Limnocylindria bacterium]|nr:DUF3048 domain-containing protein [Candidatus Limnocylindria bacterium]
MAPPPSALLRSRSVIIGLIAVVAVATGVALAVATSGPRPTAVASPTAASTATPTASPSPRRTPRPTPTPTPSATPEPVAVCPLDGLPVADGLRIDATAMAVQIENHPDARPARNLTHADMVVETTVEGDTTRFTGIFLCDRTEGMTGPVRSARYYSIDLWRDLGVLTVGFGASPGALQRFERAGMPYPNGITGAWPWYQRYGARGAPHNLYVDLEGMRGGLTANDALAALAGRTGPLRAPFRFAEEPNLPPDDGRIASIGIRTTSYWRFGWTWDEASGTWLRSDAGVAIVDEATGRRIAARTVVVQRVTEEIVTGDPDPGGNDRRLHHLVGSGNGTVFVDGRAYAARWSRPSDADGTTWTFANGEPVVLPPGQVWLEIIPTHASVTAR